MVERYEALRQQGSQENGSGWGRALFINHGMVAWMFAWSTCARTPTTAPERSHRSGVGVVSGEPPDHQSLVPMSLQAQLIPVLAEMAGTVYKGLSGVNEI